MDERSFETLKLEIEDRNLWYCFECFHCSTWFLVEESINNKLTPAEEMRPFHAHCPRCGATNPSTKGQARLKLKVTELAREDEQDPFMERVITRLEKPGQK